MIHDLSTQEGRNAYADSESKNKQKVKKLALDILKQNYEAAQLKIEKALNSGSIDVSGWDENNNPMLAPKAIVAAVLLDEVDQISAKGTSFEKQMKKDIKNIGYFI